MPEQKILSFDFASLYPTTMRDFTQDPEFQEIFRERQRQKLREERRMKIERINNLNEDGFN
jgi:hypothetical protein